MKYFMRAWFGLRWLVLSFVLLWQCHAIASWWQSTFEPRFSLSGTTSTNRTQLLGFSPNGHTLALANEQKHAVQLWDVTMGRERFTLPVEEYLPQSVTHNPEPVWARPDEVAFSPDSRLLALQVGDALTIWDLTTGQQSRTIEGRIGFATFSPDGKWLAGKQYPAAELKLWEVASGRQVAILPHRERRNRSWQSFRFSPRSEIIAFESGPDNALALWDISVGQQRTVLKGRLSCSAFSYDGSLLAVGDGELIRLYEGSTGQEVTTLTSGAGPVRSVAFSPDGRLASEAEATSGKPSATRVWDVGTRQVVGDLGSSGSNFGGELEFSGDGGLLVWHAPVSTEDSILWDVRSLPPRELYRGGGGSGSSHPRQATMRSVSVMPDSRRAVVSGLDARWPLAPANPLLGWFLTLFGIGGNRQDGALSVINLDTGRVEGSFESSPLWLLSPDGKTVVAQSYRQSVNCWDVPPRKPGILSLAIQFVLGLVVFGAWAGCSAWCSARKEPEKLPCAAKKRGRESIHNSDL